MTLVRVVGVLGFVVLVVGPASAQVMLSVDDLKSYLEGNTYAGSNPETGELVGTVTYGADGTATLVMADGTAQAGTYRLDGNAYCTRYDAFRDSSENCFTLEPLGDGRTQAYFTDGRPALLLTPVE